MASKWIIAGPSVIVLAAGLIWFGREAGVLHQLKQNQQALRKRIYAAQSPTGKETLSKGKIDWKGMLSRDLDSPSDFGMGDVRLTIGLRQRALEMTGQELISEIDRIAASDADYTKKHSLEVILLGALIQREPMLLLSKLSKPMGVDFSNIWAYNAAFRNYLRQDPLRRHSLAGPKFQRQDSVRFLEKFRTNDDGASHRNRSGCCEGSADGSAQRRPQPRAQRRAH